MDRGAKALPDSVLWISVRSGGGCKSEVSVRSSGPDDHREEGTDGTISPNGFQRSWDMGVESGEIRRCQRP